MEGLKLNIPVLTLSIFLICSGCGAFEPEFVPYSNEQVEVSSLCGGSVSNFEVNLLDDLSNYCTACHSDSGSASSFSFDNKTSSEIISRLLSNGRRWDSSSWLSSSSHPGSSVFIDISFAWQEWLSVQNSCE